MQIDKCTMTMAILSILMIALLVISGGGTWQEVKESEETYQATSGIQTPESEIVKGSIFDTIYNIFVQIFTVIGYILEFIGPFL